MNSKKQSNNKLKLKMCSKQRVYCRECKHIEGHKYHLCSLAQNIRANHCKVYVLEDNCRFRTGYCPSCWREKAADKAAKAANDYYNMYK
jgi:hypothetical protein